VRLEHRWILQNVFGYVVFVYYYVCKKYRESHRFKDTAEVFNFAAAAPLQRPNIVRDL